jgi:hypothetical protein
VPIAYFITRFGDGVGSTIYDIGDVTGDGIDEFARLWYGGPPYARPEAPTVWIYRGDRTLVSARTNHDDASIDGCDVSVFPNPVTTAHSGTLHVQCKTEQPRIADATVTDVLGRIILSQRIDMHHAGPFQFTFDVSRLVEGQYFVLVDFQTKKIIKPVTILSH